MLFLEFLGLLEEIFGDDSKKLCWLGCAILIDECWLVVSGLTRQLLKLPPQDPSPGGIHRSSGEDGGAVRKPLLGVELMGELMEGYVTSATYFCRAAQDMIPGDDQRNFDALSNGVNLTFLSDTFIGRPSHVDGHGGGNLLDGYAISAFSG